MNKDERERLTLRISQVTKYRLCKAQMGSGCRSMNELAERAIEFYLDYLESGDAGDFLPTALKSYVDGRLGQFEKHMSAMLYKLAVENDMTMGMLADNFELSEEYLRSRRSRSVQNVKRTNGQLRFEQLLRQQEDEGSYEEDE